MSRKNTLNELKEKEREVRTKLIMDAAERVFAVMPFDKVSMREIADEAGMATSSIYTYFPHQEALFVETTVRNHNELIAVFEKSIRKNRATMNIEAVISDFLDFIRVNDGYFRMMTLYVSRGNISTESAEKINSVVRKAIDLFDELFQDIKLDSNRRLLSHYFFTLLNGLLVTYMKIPGRTEEELNRHMKKIASLAADMIRSLNLIYCESSI